MSRPLPMFLGDRISNLDSLDLIDLMFNFVFEMVCFVGLSLVFRP